MAEETQVVLLGKSVKALPEGRQWTAKEKLADGARLIVVSHGSNPIPLRRLAAQHIHSLLVVQSQQHASATALQNVRQELAAPAGTSRMAEGRASCVYALQAGWNTLRDSTLRPLLDFLESDQVEPDETNGWLRTLLGFGAKDLSRLRAEVGLLVDMERCGERGEQWSSGVAAATRHAGKLRLGEIQDKLELLQRAEPGQGGGILREISSLVDQHKALP